MRLTPTPTSLFFTKNDPLDPRFGQGATPLLGAPKDIAPNFDLALWGSPDDEGISLNGGRPGASQAPLKIREYLYKMTPSQKMLGRIPRILDLGNIDLSVPLNERHEMGKTLSETLTEKQIFWVSLGGGHDYGYGDSAGFLKAELQQKPVVINFDAHLDVRPVDKGFHSGTPFYRLLKEFNGQFHFFEVGLQPQCNSVHHWQWAEQMGATLIPLSEVEGDLLQDRLASALEPLRGRPLFISFDMDAVTSTEAPGCSQSWTTGLQTAAVLKTFSWLVENFHVRGLGIYEVSPPLDQDHRTSKLAALLIYHLLQTRSQL